MSGQAAGPPSLDTPPVVIESSRAKSLGVLLIAVAFVAISALLAPGRHGRDLAEVVAGGIFFGLGIPILGWRLYRPDRLTIGPEGLVWANMWRVRRFRWADLSGFAVVRIRGSAMIAFSILNRAKPSWLAKVNKGMIGAEAALPGLWTLAPEDLCDLLNDARARWGGPSANG